MSIARSTIAVQNAIFLHPMPDVDHMDPAAPAAEFVSVRKEIQTRIVLQNVLLLLVWLATPSAMIAITAWPSASLVLAIAFDAFVTMGAAMWEHHGVRQAQLRTYLTAVLEPRLFGGTGGWEQHLASQRPRSVLGSRWWISTKGLLFGSPALVAATAATTTAVGTTHLWLLVAAGCTSAALGMILHTPSRSGP